MESTTGTGPSTGRDGRLARIAHALATLPQRLRRVTSSTSYVPQIDGLRFLAILPVLLWHASIRGHRAGLANAGMLPVGEPAWMPVGEIGVELFFFISGYIIAFPFIVAAARGVRPDIGAFYRRRLTRLEPPYIVALTLCLVLVLASGGSAGVNPGRDTAGAIAPMTSFLASLFYLHAILLEQPPLLNPPVWSLEVEIQFYLLAPLLIGGWLAIRDAATRRFAGFVAIAAGLFAAQALPAVFDRFHWVNYTLLTHAWSFFLGVLVSDVYAGVRARGKDRPRARFDALFVVGLVVFVGSGFFEYHDRPLAGLLCDIARAASFAAMFWGVLRGPRAARITGAPWIALIGGACYSIYLTHVPLMVGVAKVMFLLHPAPGYVAPVALAMIVLVPVSMAVGLAFYAAVERPCMDPHWPARLRDRIVGRR